ncbi:hypothetical protein ACF0H5_006049 [Mactra antiquata]
MEYNINETKTDLKTIDGDNRMPNDGNKVTYEIEKVPVKRRIGLYSAITFIVGVVIGSGIFISPKGALANSGSVGLCLVIWAFTGVLAIITALVFAELGVILPKSGGDYSIIKSGIGDIPAFLSIWTYTVFGSPAGKAVQMLVFADYVCAPIFSSCGTPYVIRKTIAALTLLLLAVTNTISVRLVASIQGLFTALKVGALLIIIFGGFTYLVKDGTSNFDDSFEGSTDSVQSITLAIYKCMWAYSGYTALNDFAEELQDPKKNIPRAIIISLTFVTGIYLITNVSYFTLLSKEEFLSSSAVAYAWASKALGPAAIIIPIGVMMSVYGASNGGFFSSIRISFAAARAGHLPEVLSFLHVRTKIPIASIILNTTLGIVLLIPSDIAQLINLTSFLGFLTQGFVTIALLRLRYQRRAMERKEGEFRLPIVIPLLSLAICMFMFISPLVSNPKIEFLYGLGFIFSGLIFYIPFVYLGWKLPGCDTITTFAQLCCEICPTLGEDELDLN